MATENMIIAMVDKGANRQECHEMIRQLSHEAGHRIKQEGKDNDLLERIMKSPYFDPIKDQMPSIVCPEKFIGRAPEQVIEFLDKGVAPALLPYQSVLAQRAKVSK